MEKLQCPLDTKLQLVPLLGHMFHTPAMASEARAVLTSLSETYPTRDFVLSILITLTRLTLRSLVDTHAQMELLTTHLRV
ncbi:hypothetical protein SARC_16787, partial [Sphaeroforma arctica JP610]